MYINILLILLFFCAISAAFSEDDLNEYIQNRIKVGRCRADCISEFYLSSGQIPDGNNLECTPTANWKCGMCWDYCDMLIEEEQTRNQMCSDNICLDGCKLACKFYENNQTSQDLSTKSSKICDIKLSNSLLSWNYKTGENSNLKTVFVGFGLKREGKWEELDQVSDEKISLANVNEQLLSVTIFAVTSQGIVTYAERNLAGNEIPLQENINFSVFDKLAKKQEGSSSLYLKQWTIYLIVCSVFIIVIILCFSLCFLFLHNKLFGNVITKQSVPCSISRSLSGNSVYCIDLDQTINYSTTNRL